ncbi:MAG TPA: hypothetical protein VNT02_09290, partial [Burkholderiales bacterium]|nr:hypothetical protein [Burkholderiales bacterium]
AWLEAARSLGAGKNHLIVIEACSRAAAYGDAAGWRGAMEQVERTWMEPLVGALRKRVIERLVIASPGPDVSFRFELSAGSLYKFWLPARALSAYRA